ncbi:NIF3-like protein 1 [Anthonomus grandis grandis]|uniref:NIF3-like protein 1 n=1 Tax=Anthonomus grandis grandis TaxID=2921223 RepID=UPI002164F213|nr:NIF3-like protein 1 [Anthonomus grandis grandis]
MNIFSRINIKKNIFLSTHCLFSKKSAHVQQYSQSLKAKENMGLQLQEVLKKLQELAPLKTAESWDNVGLLVEPDSNVNVNSVLLTIDLTEEVVEEAVGIGAQLIISYHPNIFRPLKTVTQSTWKERIIVKCIKNNIAVFSPHTSWDAMQNGVNDWLGSAFSVSSSKPIIPNGEIESIGMGRFLTLEQPLPLKEVIDKIKKHIGIPHIRLGLAKTKNLESLISTLALCAGSGASVLAGQSADLYLTGEMLHHDVLDATQKGISVILCNHSDSERGYLKTFQKLFANEQLAVHVSTVDKDCLTTV